METDMQPREHQEWLLGFDAREQWLAIDRLWSAERRQQYLIVATADKPWSADINVWSTIFDVGGAIQLSTLDSSLDGFDGLQLPDSFGMNRPLWDNLAHLSDVMEAEWPFADKPYCIIALTEINEGGAIRDATRRVNFERLAPVERKTSWKFAGFDVLGNQSLISGLMNCRYSPVEHEAAVAHWSAKLNDHHLFCELDAALSFKDWTDSRVPEHRPFWIGGLYCVDC
jgi:hypothetical protein